MNIYIGDDTKVFNKILFNLKERSEYFSKKYSCILKTREWICKWNGYRANRLHSKMFSCSFLMRFLVNALNTMESWLSTIFIICSFSLSSGQSHFSPYVVARCIPMLVSPEKLLSWLFSLSLPQMCHCLCSSTSLCCCWQLKVHYILKCWSERQLTDFVCFSGIRNFFGWEFAKWSRCKTDWAHWYSNTHAHLLSSTCIRILWPLGLLSRWVVTSAWSFYCVFDYPI